MRDPKRVPLANFRCLNRISGPPRQSDIVREAGQAVDKDFPFAGFRSFKVVAEDAGEQALRNEHRLFVRMKLDSVEGKVVVDEGLGLSSAEIQLDQSLNEFKEKLNVQTSNPSRRRTGRHRNWGTRNSESDLRR